MGAQARCLRHILAELGTDPSALASLASVPEFRCARLESHRGDLFHAPGLAVRLEYGEARFRAGLGQGEA